MLSWQYYIRLDMHIFKNKNKNIIKRSPNRKITFWESELKYDSIVFKLRCKRRCDSNPQCTERG